MNKGFTLIELLVVVLIIGILSAVALPQYTTAVEKARSAEALTLMSSVAGSAERYLLQKDNWPASNSFNKLDIEVPLINASSNLYGGKNFDITMGRSGDNFYITAVRKITNGKYSLQTELIQNTNGTITSIRRCCDGTASAGSCSTTYSNEKTEKFCNAVSNGKPTNF